MSEDVTGSGTEEKKESVQTTPDTEQAATATATASDSTELSDERRDQLAAQVVDRFALYSGAAGLIPLPVADIAAVAGVQLQMLRRLSKIYTVPFSENRGKSIIASLLGALIPASTSTSTAMGVGSMVKGLPGIGTTIGVISMPVFSAAATFVIGKVFIQHFASGGTLLDFNPPDYREFIKAHREKLGVKSTEPPTPEPSPTPPDGSNKEASATGH